jgi:YHS domain-containing protein
MRSLKLITGIILTAAFVIVPLAGRADGTNSVSSAAAKPKPDLLTTCPVSGDKLGEMGKPLVFVYQGQEVKLCCGGCKKDFDKDPAKYIKKIREADKKDTKS